MQTPRYRIVRPLGRGGMAEVHLAEAADGTRVALKRVLPEHAGDARFRRMFLDEARIASRLSHPGIVRVLASGELDGSLFIALEWVDGRDATSWSARAGELGVALPEVAALRVGAEVARALHAAHEARDGDEPLGIVHRDVTPGNVLISRDGRVLLGDFGIAKARDRLERTSIGTTKGKLAFMAPEQMLGGEVDRRADVFSLGCTLHWLLTGRSAIGGEDGAATLMAGADLALAPELEDDVRAVLARALSPSRVRRWPTAKAMADALEDVLAARGTDGRESLRAFVEQVDDGSQESEAVMTPPRSALASRRGLAVAGASILTLSIVATAIGFSPWTASPPQEATPSPAADPPVMAVEAPAIVAPRATVAAAPIAEVAEEPAVEAPRSPSSSRSAPPPRARRTPSPPTVEPPAPSPPAPSPPAPSPPAGPAPTGFLAVGGPGAVRRVVYVDGQRRDFAPLTVELPARTHTVELRDAEGAPVAQRQLEIREDHTRRSPLRWIVAMP